MKMWRLFAKKRSIGTAKTRLSLLRLTAGFFVALILLTVVMVLPWRWIPPPTTTFILRERFLIEDPVYYRWTRWEDISPNLAIAVVASEDQKFPSHYGFDLEQIADALRARDSGRIRGASTISQQVAKNLFLWPDQTVFRKTVEAYLTVCIETFWPKQRILEVYLNVAEFGPGIFGVATTSQQAFGKPPSELTLDEAALMAAVLPSPKRMSITNPSEYVRRRADEIVSAVIALGGVSYISNL